MKYVGLIFHAPMQSWSGVSLPDPNFSSPRNTELAPTKSAILGFLRSAMGLERSSNDNEGLKNSRILIRIDDAGLLGRDFTVAQRTHHGFRAGPTKVIPKYHLQDATFVVMVGNEDSDLMEQVALAIQNPKWAPFLGRRAYVPSLPPFLGIVETDDPRRFLGAEIPIIWKTADRSEKRVTTYDSVIDPDGQPHIGDMVDNPVSMHPIDRSYSLRRFQLYNVTYRNDNNKNSMITQYGNLIEAFTEGKKNVS